MVAFDYQSITDRITTTLKTKSLWTDIPITGTEANLIYAVSQEMAYSNQYKEYQTFENFWDKARNISSLLVEAPVHGYQVPRKTSAQGTERVGLNSTFDIPATKNVILPKYFQFSNGTTFVATVEDNQISIGQSYIDVLVFEGTSKSVSFLAQGLAFETKQITESSLENSLFDLYVNNVLWTNISTIYDANPTDLVYEIIYDPSLTFFTLRFGDGVFGKQLSLNDSIIFKYISTSGINGNVGTIGNIKNVETQAYDTSSNPVTLYCTNTTAISGGKDYPTIEQIRSTSPQVYQTGGRATSRPDITTIISGYSYISKVYVWGVKETNQDNNVDPWTFIPAEENVNHLACLNASFQGLSTLEKQEIINSLYQIADPTDIYQFETVEIVNLLFVVNAYVTNSSYSLPSVKTLVTNTLQNTYSIQNAQFNTNLYASDFEALIDNLNGVKYHDSEIYIIKKFGFNSAYITSGITLPILPVSGATLEIYITQTPGDETSYVKIGQSDSNGTISSVTSITYPSINLSGSTCDVNTGSITILINSGLSGLFTNFTLKAKYQSSTKDLNLGARSQIFAYYDSSVNTYYAQA